MNPNRYLQNRNGWYQFYQRVPKRYSDLVPNEFVRQTLHTRDIHTARVLRDRLERENAIYWERLAALGGSGDAEAAYKAAVELVTNAGLEFKKLTELSVQDIWERNNAFKKSGGTEAELKAFFGNVPEPEIRLSKALNLYYEITRDVQHSKTERELRRWRNERDKAVRNFCDYIGDLDLKDITRAKALKFRERWVERLEKEDLKPNTVNKDLSALDRIFKEVSEKHGLGLQSPFSGLRLRETKSTKTSFDTDFVRSTLLNRDRLSGLNDDAWWLLCAKAELGARTTELCSLDWENDVFLDVAIPYIHIRSNKLGGLKNSGSERKLPLVGAALAAFQNVRCGFGRYFQAPDTASTAITKYLSENELLPSRDHTFNSLRHSFEDRLTEAVGEKEKLQAYLMGHSYSRPRYGKPPSLTLLLPVMRKTQLLSANAPDCVIQAEPV